MDVNLFHTYRCPWIPLWNKLTSSSSPLIKKIGGDTVRTLMIRLCLINLHHLFYVMLIYWNPSEGQHETLNRLWIKSLFYFLFFHSFLWGKCDTCWVFDLPSHKNPAGLIHIYALDCFKVHFRFNQPLRRALGMWGLSLRQIQEHIHSLLHKVTY